MSESRVTVIICTEGKRPRFLADALRSLASQSVRPRVVVVVNRGPGTDRSQAMDDAHELIERAGFRWPEALVVPGPGDSYANGVNAALEHVGRLGVGRFVGFLDDDDVLYPGHVAKLLRAITDPIEGFDAEGRPERAELPDAVYSDVLKTECDPTTNEPRAQGAGHIFGGAFTVEALRVVNQRPLLGFLFRAETLRHVRVERDHMCADWSILLDLAWRGARMLHVPGVSAEYRVRNGGNSNNDGGALNADTVRVRAFWDRRWPGRVCPGCAGSRRVSMRGLFGSLPCGRCEGSGAVFACPTHSVYAADADGIEKLCGTCRGSGDVPA